MENKNFQNFINLLKKLEPDSSFLAHSKTAIISTDQATRVLRLPMRFFEGITVRTSFAFASIVIIAAIVSISIFASPTSRLAGSLDDSTLVVEATEANLQIEIAEAAYFDQSAQRVALALDKISGVEEEKEND